MTENADAGPSHACSAHAHTEDENRSCDQPAAPTRVAHDAPPTLASISWIHGSVCQDSHAFQVATATKAAAAARHPGMTRAEGNRAEISAVHPSLTRGAGSACWTTRRRAETSTGGATSARAWRNKFSQWGSEESGGVFMTFWDFEKVIS